MPVSSSMDVRDTLTPALREASKAIRNWKRFWPAAQSVIYQGLVQVFNEKGPGWAPLAKSTPPRRKAGDKTSSALPLLASGRLRASVTSGRGRDSTTAKEPLELRFGTSLAYAPAMHFGLPARTGQVREHLSARKRKRGGRATIWNVRAHTVRLPAVPARPFIKFTPRMVDGIQTGAARYIESEFARGAGK